MSWRLCSVLVLRYGGAAAIDSDGQHDGDRVGEAAQIHALALCGQRIDVIANWHNVDVQAHTVEGPREDEISVELLLEGALWSRYREGPNLHGHPFGDRFNPVTVCTQGEGLPQNEAGEF